MRIKYQVNVQHNGGAVYASVSDRTQRVSRKYAGRIAQNARGRVHVITGRLRDSITVYPISSKSFTVRAGDGPAYYAPFEELGHALRGGGYFPGHPFLRPAANEEKDQYVAEMRAELGA